MSDHLTAIVLEEVCVDRDRLRAERDELLMFLREIKRLASDPFASDTVSLRACLLAANEGLRLPGPQPSPERDIARAVLHEMRFGEVSS